MTSLIPAVEPQTASVDIQRIYEAGIKQHGFVFNNWKLFANAPHLLRPFTQFIGAVLNPRALSKRELELAILKTSLRNECHY